LGFGRPLLSHSRGPSTQPGDITTTFASSVCSSPLRVSRHVTPRATRLPPAASSLTMPVTKASVTSVAGLPPRRHASAVSAIGT
jgi:hypothetical protein